MARFRRLRLFTLLILFSGVGLIVRVGNVADGVADLSGQALAQEEAGPQQPASQDAAATQDATATEQRPAGDESASDVQPDTTVTTDQPEKTPTNIGNVDPLMMTRSELDLLQNLAERRAELDDREKQLDLRDRLLGATEKRIDDKIARLEALQTQLSDLVEAHEQQENKQLDSIVKVYESMKPKDAAPIFQRLDMSIQLEIATRMREAKMAPILAEMDADAARKLTTQLASRVELPDIEG